MFACAKGVRRNAIQGGSNHAEQASRRPPTTAQVVQSGANSTESRLYTGESAAWLRDDDALVVDGAIGRTEFLQRLEQGVRQSVEEALASDGACTACPYLDYWFGQFQDEPAQHLRRVLSRYDPEAAAASSPEQALRILWLRAGQKAQRWLVTGRVDGLPTDLNGGADVAATESDEPLGDGHPLDSGIRGRFEPALGIPLAHVRVHADERGNRMASAMNASAVTVGRHLAFRNGEFQPGTPHGDALLAHELIHSEQQRRGGGSRHVPASRALESEANRHAIAAMARLWTHASELPSAGPITDGGLSFQRCDSAKVNCDERSGTVSAAFTTAQEWVRTALERSRSNPPHPNVLPALRGAFRTNGEDTSQLPVVIRGLEAIQSELSAAHTLYCPGRGPDCGPNMDDPTLNIAFVRTRNEGERGSPIYFCPTFFEPGNSQPLTVIHEAGHLSPGFYPDLTYWGRDDYSSLATDRHLHNADSYATFVYWVVNGSAPPTGTGRAL